MNMRTSRCWECERSLATVRLRSSELFLHRLVREAGKEKKAVSELEQAADSSVKTMRTEAYRK
jgi:hypothetical protein